MTKTTQAVIVAAVTATAVLTTQTIVHHYWTPVLSRVRQLQEPLTTQRAAQAKQTATDFFEAMGKADWNKIDKLWVHPRSVSLE